MHTLKKEHKISEYINVAPRYLRSVNIFLDSNSEESSNGYVVTDNVANAISLITNTIISDGNFSKESYQQKMFPKTRPQTPPKAYSVIGSYGAGKSAFALYLSNILSSEHESAKKLIELIPNKYSDLKQNLISFRLHNSKGFLPILISARKSNINKIFLEGFLKSISYLKENKETARLIADIELSITTNSFKDSSCIIKFIEQIRELAIIQGYNGVLLVIDEVGKTLEYALFDKEHGDIFIFQELAEYVNRIDKTPIIFITIMHQMINDYVEISDRNKQDEWSKIQERFEPIYFSESILSTIELISNSIQLKRELPNKIAKLVDDILSDIQKCGVKLPTNISNALFNDIAIKGYPFHPLVLIAIPYLFRRVAQNERSIFSYLTSNLNFAFQEYINNNNINSFIRLSDLFDYFVTNFETNLSRHAYTRPLLIANDIINNSNSLSLESSNLIKTIAILNVLEEISPLKTNQSLISVSLSNSDNITKQLEKLKKESILTYRHLNNTYHIFENSDISIEELILYTRKRKRDSAVNLLDTVKKYLPTKSILARRHSLEKGIQRFFNLIYLDNSLLATNELKDDSKILENAILNNNTASAGGGGAISCNITT